MAWKWKNFLRNILRKTDKTLPADLVKDRSQEMICNDALSLLSENEKQMIVLRSQVRTKNNAMEEKWQQ